MNYLDYKHHPIVDKLLKIIGLKTSNSDTSMILILICYHLSKLASMMRCSIDAKGLGKFPVNFYGIALAPSGKGKGYCNSIIEEQVIKPFINTFMEFTRPFIVETKLKELASKRSFRKNSTFEEEYDLIQKEFKKLGEYLTAFDSGTVPAIKQFRESLIMSDIGSINFEVDEIGSNLIKNTDIIELYLELWDGGVKNKITKNTNDSIRNEQLFGKTPTNLLGFGTPVDVFDGSSNEKLFKQLLTKGYARRTFWGYTPDYTGTIEDIDIQARLNSLLDYSSDDELFNIASILEKLADPLMHNWIVECDIDILTEILKYQAHNEMKLNTLRASDEIRRAELRNRHSKTIRLAGVFAFLDKADSLTKEHWESAVRVAEESGLAFEKMLRQDPPYARLAKFLADLREPATLADILGEIPFFPSTSNAQRDMINHAIAWGYKNNITIKQKLIDDVLHLQGEQLKLTDLNHILLSNSNDIATNYFNADAVWEELPQLYTATDMHWCNHHFINGNRRLTEVIPKFNIIVLDIDGTCSLDFAKEVLKPYTYHMYTTKRHTPEVNRFRIILPMSHELKLNNEEYSEFMRNILEILPFKCDEAANQTNRKWLSNPNADVYENEGILFDILPYIPKTEKNIKRQKYIQVNADLSNLELFFLKEAETGNRNNTLFRYGASLLDVGHNLDTIKSKLILFNSKLQNPLSKSELDSTIINSIERRYLSK